MTRCNAHQVVGSNNKQRLVAELLLDVEEYTSTPVLSQQVSHSICGKHEHHAFAHSFKYLNPVEFSKNTALNLLYLWQCHNSCFMLTYQII